MGKPKPTYLVIVREDYTVFEISEIPREGFSKREYDSEMRTHTSCPLGDGIQVALDLGYTNSFTTKDLRGIMIEKKIPKRLR